MTGLLRYARRIHQPLAQNPQHSFAANHALVHYPSGAIYSMIPKNGCSTLRLSLGIGNNILKGPGDFRWIHMNNETFRADLGALVRAPFSFVILRCPYRRLASAYLDKIVGKERDMWDLFRRSGEAFDPDQLSFAGFLNLLETPLLRNLNVHWRPQVDFLVYDDYTHWFALERADRIAPVLRDAIGLELFDARPLTNHGTDGKRLILDQDFSDVPAHEIAALKRENRLPSHETLFTGALTGKLGMLYASDIDLYCEVCDPSDLLFARHETETTQ
ncbi:MAG: sulfotransferase family protein [Silicimonas sp.]|nr:sulfotransferase family protein [Silicimonas sp.]